MIPRIGETRHPGFNAGVLWRDENFDILAAAVPGNNNLPTPVVYQGIPYAGFPGGAIAEVPVHKEYNHCGLIRQKGVVKPQIRPHIHFSPTTANAGNVKWFFAYRIHFGAVEIVGTLSVVYALSGVAWQEQRVELGAIEFPETLWNTGVQIGGRFYRDPTGDAEDTYPDTVVITDTAGWHFPIDSDGSIGIFEKYGAPL